MSDQCSNCMMRGDYEQCQKTTCGHHDNWISLEHLKLITALRQQLTEARESVDRIGTGLCELCVWKQRAEKAEADAKQNLDRYLAVSQVLADATERPDLGSAGMAKLLEQENKRLLALLNSVHEISYKSPELDMCNYDHDQVAEINSDMVEIFTLLTDEFIAEQALKEVE